VRLASDYDALDVANKIGIIWVLVVVDGCWNDLGSDAQLCVSIG
jgi:hypothetical protein